MFELIITILLIVVFPALAGGILPADKTQLPQRWLAGLLLLGLIITFGHGLGVNHIATYALAGILITLGAINIVRHYQWPAFSFSPYWFAAGIVIAIIVLLTWTEVINFPLHGGDAVVIWFNKARSIYLWQSLVQIPINTYPNLGASLWAGVMTVAGYVEYLGRLVFPTAYIFWCANLLRHKLKHPLGQTLYLITAASLSIYLLNAGMWDGYQDMLLSIVAANGVYLLARVVLQSKHWKWDLGLGLFFISTLYLIKNEGAVLAAIIFVGFVIALAVSQRPRKLMSIARKQLKLICMSLAVLVIPALLWIFTLTHSQIDPSQVQGGAFSIKGLLEIPQRLPTYLPPILHYLRIDITALLPVIALAIFMSVACLIIVKSRRVVALNLFLWLILILHIAFIIVTFLATNSDQAWHLDAAFHRLMTQHELVYVIVILTNLGLILDKELADLVKKLKA